MLLSRCSLSPYFSVLQRSDKPCKNLVISKHPAIPNARYFIRTLAIRLFWNVATGAGLFGAFHSCLFWNVLFRTLHSFRFGSLPAGCLRTQKYAGFKLSCFTTPCKWGTLHACLNPSLFTTVLLKKWVKGSDVGNTDFRDVKNVDFWKAKNGFTPYSLYKVSIC